MQNQHTTAMEGGSADYAGAVIYPPHPVHKSRHLQRFCAAEETVQETLARLCWQKTQPPKSPLSGGLVTQFPPDKGG